jgi:hypothetical protein
MKQFAADGSLLEETHAYGMLEIGITIYFKVGTKVSEAYFKKGQMVTRPTYEKARISYPDMPAANGACDDCGAALEKLESKRRRERSAVAKGRTADPKAARQQDLFCNQVIKEGRTEKAEEWIDNKSHTLGELDWAASKRLVRRLSAMGCTGIFACEVDQCDDGTENTGHLVVRLPKAAKVRAKVFKFIDELAHETGYEGPLDDGQQFAYVKLD